MPAQIKVDISDAAKKLGLLEKNLRPALLVEMAHAIFLMTRHSFEQERSPEGVPWPQLSNRYGYVKAKLFPMKGILQRRGGLLRSVFETVEGNRAIIGATMPYAAIHQYGGLAGRKHKAKIPARPFLPGEETAAKEAQRAAEYIVQDVIDRQGAGPA
jgi:phage virion morphogenesis protein